MNAATVLPGFLRSLPPLSLLGDQTFATALRSTQRRTYARDHRIVQSGDTSSGLFVLIAGRAKRVLESSNGAQLTIDFLHPNDMFGELGALDGLGASTTVVAIHTCDVLHIPRSVVRACSASEPQFAAHLLQHTLARLRESYSKLATLGLHDVYQRVARTLLDNSSTVAGELIADTGSEELARMVGASREMVSRVLRTMWDGGLICRKRRDIVIVDPHALARAGCGTSPPPRAPLRALQDRARLATPGRTEPRTPRAQRAAATANT